MSDKSQTINDLTALVDLYSEEPNEIFNEHCTQQHWLMALRQPTPLTSVDIQPETPRRRQQERKWGIINFRFIMMPSKDDAIELLLYLTHSA